MAKGFKVPSDAGPEPEDGEHLPLSSKEDRQFAHVGDGDPSGGNMSGGRAQAQPLRLTVVAFQGRSGQSDNQSTNRPAGAV